VSNSHFTPAPLRMNGRLVSVSNRALRRRPCWLVLLGVVPGVQTVSGVSSSGKRYLEHRRGSSARTPTGGSPGPGAGSDSVVSRSSGGRPGARRR
jgi:hypothetical protein